MEIRLIFAVHFSIRAAKCSSASIVSRETLVKISKDHGFLIENNRKMSLISKNSENIAIDRHYVDCAQLIKYLDKSDKTILDIGSGKGQSIFNLALNFKFKKWSSTLMDPMFYGLLANDEYNKLNPDRFTY